MAAKTLGVLVVLGILCSCRQQTVLVGDHPKELVGTWQLLVRSSCNQYGVKSDALTLHADGTFDQQVIFDDGKRVSASAQHWDYNADGSHGHIALDKRLEFFEPELTQAKKGGSAGMFEVLLVDFQYEPVILLNPDSDCVYGKE